METLQDHLGITYKPSLYSHGNVPFQLQQLTSVLHLAFETKFRFTRQNSHIKTTLSIVHD